MTKATVRVATGDRTGTLHRVRVLTVVALLWAIGSMGIGMVLVAGEPSGACQGWPLCNGSVAAPSDGAGVSAMAHRASGLALLITMGVALFIAASRLPGERWLVRILAGGFVVGLSHAVLGGIGVALTFPSWITAIHMGLALGTSLLLFAVISLISATTTTGSKIDSFSGTLAAGGVIALSLALIVGAGLGSPRIPLTTQIGEAAGSSGFIQVMVVAALIGVLALAVKSTKFGVDRARTSFVLLVAAIASAGVISQVDLGSYAEAVPALFATIAVFPLASIAFQVSSPGLAEALGGESTWPSIARLRVAARDLARVTKPGIMLLLLTTTFTSMLAATRGWPGGTLVLWTLLGGALASGGASALNCYLDRDVDQIMARTRKRPIPTGTLSADAVRAFALILSVLSALVLAVFVNPLAALLAVAGNVFYVAIYTMWLKRSTPQNIVIGGAAGSFPPLVGWAAATGTLGIAPLLLALIVFLWTPPHFWSLALLKANDYRRAGIPMLPVTHGEAHTRYLILAYSVLLVAITVLLVPAGGAGALYLVVATLLGAGFVSYAVRMYREGTSRLAWSLFKYSNYYLAALLFALALDSVLGL